MKTSFKIIALSTLGFTTLCFANEPQETNFLTDMFSKSHFDKDFSASVGLRLWENKWNLPYWRFDAQYPRVFANAYQNDMVVASNSNNTSVDIPAIGLRYKNFFLGGSYFKQTEYGFNGQDRSDSYKSDLFNSVMTTPYNLSQNAKRNEWDVGIGYYFNKYLMLTAGYKTINRSYNYLMRLDNTFGLYDWAGPNVVNSTVGTYNLRSKGKGPIIGISGSVPMGNTGFNLYGNISYGRLKTSQTSSNFSTEVSGQETRGDSSPTTSNYNNNYYSGEFGVSYVIPFKDNYFSAISMSLGYRFQRYEFKDVLSPSIAQTAVDTTDGFVAGINILF